MPLPDSGRPAADISAIDGLALRAAPDTTLVAFGAADPPTLDVFAVADALWDRGWYVDRQGPPASLHGTVTAGHEPHIAAFASALRESVEHVRQERARGDVGTYGTVD